MTDSRPTMVFVPGLLSDSSVWRAVAGELCEHARVECVDVLEGDSITAMATSALDRLDGPTIVAGHSMGARIAMEMVRLAPERTAGLVLANTGLHTRRPDEETQRQMMINLAYDKGMSALADIWLPRMVAEARQHDAQLVGQLKDMVLRSDPSIHERQLRALLKRPDPGPGLAQIGCPVLLLAGRQDQWSPVAQHQEIAAHVSDPTLVVIEEAGHFAPVEQPAAVSKAIRDWLARLRNSRPPSG